LSINVIQDIVAGNNNEGYSDRLERQAVGITDKKVLFNAAFSI
jgi:hypothetical protein